MSFSSCVKFNGNEFNLIATPKTVSQCLTWDSEIVETTDIGENRLAPEKTYPDREKKKGQSDLSISQRTSKQQYSRSWSRSRDRKWKSDKEGRKHRTQSRSKEARRHESKDMSSKRH